MTKKRTILTIIWVSLMVLGTCLIAWRAFFGLAEIDEAFYLAVPFRLLQGDRFFIDEYHMSQLSAFLLLPPMKIWLVVTGGSTEGIFLAFRLLFAACASGMAIFTFFRLKKLSLEGALLASVAILLFSPYGINALSYNSMGVFCLSGALILLVTMEKHFAFQEIVSGILYAFAVLCCPYLLLLCPVYLIVIGLARIRSGKEDRNENGNELLRLRCWIRVTLGAALAAIAFFVYLFAHSSINELLEALPRVLSFDVEHTVRPFFSTVWSWFVSLTARNTIVMIVHIGFAFLMILWAVGKKRIPEGAFLAAGIILAGVQIAASFIRGGLLSDLLAPVVPLALLCTLLFHDRENLTLFHAGVLPGICFSFFAYWGSNQGHLAANYALAPSAIIGIIILCRCVRLEQGKGALLKALCPVAACVLALILLGTEAWDRYSVVFWDEGNTVADQASLVEEGPQKGLTISYDKEDFLLTKESDLFDAQYYDDVQNIMYLSNYSWMYLYTPEYRNASLSPWLFEEIGDILDELEYVWNKYPDRKADLIYVDSTYIDYAETICERFGYEAEYSWVGSAWLSSGQNNEESAE